MSHKFLSHKPDLADDFSTQGDGALTVSPTGHTWDCYSVGGDVPVISGGRLVNAGTVNNGYCWTDLGAKPIKFGGHFSLQPSSGGVSLLSGAVPRWDTLTVPILHLKFITTNYYIQVASNATAWPATLVSVGAIGYFTPNLLTDGTVYSFYAEINGNVLTLTLPDGSTVTRTDDRFLTYPGRFCCWELYNGGGSARWEDVMATTAVQQ